MPTGYTYTVVEGQCTSFREFAMQCARAFGATITMRDDPMDKPIPDEFKPDDYYAQSVLNAIDEVRNLESLSPDEQREYGEKKIAEAFQYRVETRAKYKLENDRIDRMLAEVVAWEPPSPDHVGMKKFMIEQLETSKHTFEWLDEQAEEAIEDPMEVFNQALAAARKNVVNRRKYHAEEVEWCESRTRWVRQLRESLQAIPA